MSWHKMVLGHQQTMMTMIWKCLHESFFIFNDFVKPYINQMTSKWAIRSPQIFWYFECLMMLGNVIWCVKWQRRSNRHCFAWSHQQRTMRLRKVRQTNYTLSNRLSFIIGFKLHWQWHITCHSHDTWLNGIVNLGVMYFACREILTVWLKDLNLKPCKWCFSTDIIL